MIKKEDGESNIDNEIETPNDHKYFTMIPNIIFEIGLSPHALTLYCLIRRVAGEIGRCWMSTTNLADKCNMSTGTVSASKQELCSAGLIGIEIKTCDKGEYHEIRIIDIWKRNIDYFTNSTDEQVGCSTDEQVRSPVELKKNSINKNQEIVQETLQSVSTAKGDESQMPTTEDYKQRTTEAYFNSFANASVAYAHYPEDIRPVVERMARLWHFRPPERPRKKGGQYAFWIEQCREILEACGEFGVEMLDDLHADWQEYLETHSGLAPYAIQTPRSLLGAVSGKARLLRSGSKQSQWADSRKPGQLAHQSTLDV